MPTRLAVLASGGGTNLQALIDRFNAGRDTPARVELVVGSRAGIGALQRAEAGGIPCATLSPVICGQAAFPGALLQALESHAIDLIVLAGYLQLLPGEVVERFRGRILNIHPALLPSFGGQGMYGARVHQAVLRSGARVSGATVHLVDERYDEGAIVAQWPVPVVQGDTPETLAARVLQVEHVLLPVAIEIMIGREAARPQPADAFRLTSAEQLQEAEIRALNA